MGMWDSHIVYEIIWGKDYIFVYSTEGFKMIETKKWKEIHNGT